MSNSTTTTLRENVPLPTPEEPPIQGRAVPGARFVFATVAFGIALFFALSYLAENWVRESTDDAFIDGDIVGVASKVPGEVAETHVQDNQAVKAGDLLVEVDPRDLEVRLSQKRAAVLSMQASQQALQAGFDLIRARIKTAEATRKQSDAQAEASKAAYDNAEANWKRADKLWGTAGHRGISGQDLENAKATMLTAKANWQADLDKATSDASRIVESQDELVAAEKAYDEAGAKVNQAQEDVRAAELDLSYAKITAPVDGRITRKMVQKGAYIQVGQSLLAIVRPEIWVTANFKETQTAKIRAGQPVRLKVDGMNRTLRGHVQSLQSGSGARFSLLPPENAVGNYVKVVQRVPVKIVFDEPVQAIEGLGPGLSVMPSVQVGQRAISDTVMAVVAVVVALLGGGLVWFFGQRRANNQGRP